ncbi:MAG: hypothetical protein M3Q73_00035 [bacterium]|nr:hypothetical protein [bacterium]
MESEERKILEKLLHISEHNNRILSHMRREMLFHRYYRVFVLLFAIGAAVVIYYYIKPYIENVVTTLETAAIERGLR